MSDIAEVKKLREETGLGLVACKQAIERADNDYDKAKQLVISESSGKLKPERAARSGTVACYIHHDHRIGSLVSLTCETDFVANTPSFGQLAQDIAQQVVGTNPENVDDLLKQPFLKNSSLTIKELIAEHAGKYGENVTIDNFSRYDLGSRFKAL